MIIGALLMLNFIMLRNCSIFCSIKFYPAICNYSLFKKMGGKFQFSRDVPSVIGPPVDFESKRKSFETKGKRQKKGEANEFELEQLHKKKGNELSNIVQPELEIVIDRR